MHEVNARHNHNGHIFMFHLGIEWYRLDMSVLHLRNSYAGTP